MGVIASRILHPGEFAGSIRRDLPNRRSLNPRQTRVAKTQRATFSLESGPFRDFQGIEKELLT